jgi:hypothetical protein
VVQQKINNPESNADYLIKLSYISGKSQYDLFIIAGKEQRIPEYLSKKDFDNWIKSGCQSELPDYVIEFMEPEKEFIRTTPASPFSFKP